MIYYAASELTSDPRSSASTYRFLDKKQIYKLNPSVRPYPTSIFNSSLTTYNQSVNINPFPNSRKKPTLVVT
jgi:hypothetical protein